MNAKKKLTKAEARAADRIGKKLAERTGLFEMTEGDILDAIFWATEAIDLADGKFHTFEVKVYKSILERQPAFAERLVARFLHEIRACED